MQAALAGGMRRGEDAASLAESESESESESDAVSLALSVVLALDAGVVPIDSERFASICAKMERLRSGVAKRDAKLREAKAKLREQRKRIRSGGCELNQARAQLSGLASELASERRWRAEAVEKAAAALEAGELLRAENNALRMREQELAGQLSLQHAATAQLGDAQLGFAAQVRALQSQLSTQARKLQESGEERHSLLRKVNVLEQYAMDLANQKLALEVEVRDLPSKDEQERRDLSQQQTIAQLETDRRQLQNALAIEQKESKRHATYLMKVILQLESEVESARLVIGQQKDQLVEVQELQLMLNEEIYSRNDRVYRLKTIQRKQRNQHQQLMRQYQELSTKYQDLDASRRRMANVFIPTKKHLASISAAMSRLCEELQGVGKIVALGRFREAVLGRALREYGRRNRKLQSSLGSARQKLKCVADALRISEQRKSEVISASATLRRDLVVEKCQRFDLFRECQELSACLDQCQGAVNETEARADALHEDNDSLQLAVQQLIAYAQVLAQSQQSLEHELRQLEVAGLREPAVFG